MRTVIHYIEDFIGLLYPAVCVACGRSLYRYEILICTNCLYHIPKTNFHFFRENPISRIFWGRVEIETATAYYFFDKGSRFNVLIHKMKYRGQKEIGYELGKIFGNELKTSRFFNQIDLIVPVPLHPKKQRKRGYNQSEWIARGIADSMHKPVDIKSLCRIVDTESQTNKTKYERWKNVENIFAVKYPESLKGKHVLIVDDVITTGSTLEACASAILDMGDTKISAATLAMA